MEITTSYGVLPGAARVHIPAVGRRQILPGADIPGTVGIVTRTSATTYMIEVRDIEGWMVHHPLQPYGSVSRHAGGGWTAELNTRGAYEGIGVYREVESAIGTALAQLALIGREDGVW
jgi:hypothetical protein